jgi:hypothetical protein
MRILLLAALVATQPPSTSRADSLTLPLDSPDEIVTAKGGVTGHLTVVAGKSGSALRLADAAFWLPTQGNFSPTQGSIDFWVRPLWAGTDKQEHVLVHLQSGKTELTVLKTALYKRGKAELRLVYRGTPETNCTVDFPIRDWQASQWHQITASWMPVAAGQLLIALRADEREGFASGAVPFAHVPEPIWIGARSAKWARAA